jgi:hypothetical protein
MPFLASILKGGRGCRDNTEQLTVVDQAGGSLSVFDIRF